MFGESGVFSDGVMPSIVTDNYLLLRVGDGNRATFRKARPSLPLIHARKGEPSIDGFFDLWSPVKGDDGEFTRINPNIGVVETQSGLIGQFFDIRSPKSWD